MKICKVVTTLFALVLLWQLSGCSTNDTKFAPQHDANWIYVQVPENTAADSQAVDKVLRGQASQFLMEKDSQLFFSLYNPPRKRKMGKVLFNPKQRVICMNVPNLDEAVPRIFLVETKVQASVSQKHDLPSLVVLTLLLDCDPAKFK